MAFVFFRSNGTIQRDGPLASTEARNDVLARLPDSHPMTFSNCLDFCIRFGQRGVAPATADLAERQVIGLACQCLKDYEIGIGCPIGHNVIRARRQDNAALDHSDLAVEHGLRRSQGVAKRPCRLFFGSHGLETTGFCLSMASVITAAWSMAVAASRNSLRAGSRAGVPSAHPFAIPRPSKLP